MLSTKEIVAYVQGPAKPVVKQEFSVIEAREIGESLGIRWDTFDLEQFAMGVNVELEHGRRDPETDVTDDEPVRTGKIALAHLREIPDYYTRLAAMEDEAIREKRTCTSSSSIIRRSS